MKRPDAFDMHCHLDLYERFEHLVDYCDQNRIVVLTMTTTPRAWKRNLELCRGRRFVRPALGFHPQLVADILHEWPLFMSHFSSARYIGEIGLDGGAEYRNAFASQKSIFKKIIEACNREPGKILSVHSRRASRETIEILKDFLNFNASKVILHWFTGTPAEAKEAAKLGCYFSINSEMVRSKRGAETIKLLPIEKIFTETDGPFTRRGARQKEPQDVIQTHSELSRLLGVSDAGLREQLFQNLISLTGGVSEA